MNDEHVISSPRNEDPNEAASVDEARLPVAKRNSFIPQVSLVTLFLAIALIAVWLAWWQTGQSIERLERQMPGLRNVARELFVDDPAMFAVVKQVGQWFGENICRIHVPADQSYQLCLALEFIDEEGFPDPLRFVSLPSGEHQIEIRYDTQREESIVRILVDEQTVIQESRPKDWEPRVGSSGGMPFTQSTQYPTDGPVILFRRRFSVPSGVNPPTSPSAGILVWVEPDESDGQ